MKKTLFVVLFLTLLSVGTVATSSYQYVQAAAPTVVKGSPTPTSQPTAPTPTPTIEYVLPYPGILPTHPLYFLKAIRDRIIEFLIADPVKRAEFYILQADKKLNMAVFLANSQKSKEAQQALTDAHALREKAVRELEVLKKAGTSVPRYVIEKLSTSLDKHVEVTTAFGQGKDLLIKLIERTQSLFGGYK